MLLCQRYGSHPQIDRTRDKMHMTFKDSDIHCFKPCEIVYGDLTSIAADTALSNVDKMNRAYDNLSSCAVIGNRKEYPKPKILTPFLTFRNHRSILYIQENIDPQIN